MIVAIGTKNISQEIKFNVSYDEQEAFLNLFQDVQNLEIYGNVKLELEYNQEKDLAQIGMLAVNANYLRYGLGKLLLLEAENIARKLGFTKVRIENLAPRDWVHPFR